MVAPAVHILTAKVLWTPAEQLPEIDDAVRRRLASFFFSTQNKGDQKY